MTDLVVMMTTKKKTMSTSIEGWKGQPTLDIDNYEELEDKDLLVLDTYFQGQKSVLRRQMDNIDTDLVAIREILRKRKETRSLGESCLNSFIAR